MPVTKTAKRALRSSQRKFNFNRRYLSRLEIAVRRARKSRNSESIKNALSLVDRAVNKNIIHKNKASRIKSTLAKFSPKSKPSKKSKTRKKQNRIRKK